MRNSNMTIRPNKECFDTHKEVLSFNNKNKIDRNIN